MRHNIAFSEGSRLEIIKYVIATMTVLLLGSIIILSQGNSPVEAFSALLSGAFGSNRAIGTTIRWVTPSIITGISALIAFKSGIWNVGIEGQMYLGAFFSAIVGYQWALPSGLHVLVCLLVAGLCGLAYAMIPALLKLFLNVNELISTLMLNYVAVYITEFMTFKYMGFDASELADAIATPEMQRTARLGIIIPRTNATTGIYIAIGVALLIYLFYRHTVRGYELKMVGKNLKFAKYGGVKYKSTFMMIFLLSGFIAGVCGGMEMTGNFGKFRTEFAVNLGWDGVMIASIAKNNPIAVIACSFIWGALKAGSLQMERVTATNRLVVSVLQAIFVLMVAIDYKSLKKWYVDKRQYRLLSQSAGVK